MLEQTDWPTGLLQVLWDSILFLPQISLRKQWVRAPVSLRVPIPTKNPLYPQNCLPTAESCFASILHKTLLLSFPGGKTTVAFSEPQIHAILKTVSDEPVKSSLHSLRSLVLQAVHGGKRQTAGQLRKALIKGPTHNRGMTASSEGESDSEGYTTDDNTSGAYATDEERGGASMSQEVESDSSTPACKIVCRNERNRQRLILRTNYCP